MYTRIQCVTLCSFCFLTCFFCANELPSIAVWTQIDNKFESVTLKIVRTESLFLVLWSNYYYIQLYETFSTRIVPIFSEMFASLFDGLYRFNLGIHCSVYFCT